MLSNMTYVYWTMHHLDSRIKINQLDVTCFIISLFTAQQVSKLVQPSSGACDLLWIYFMCCIALVQCVLVLRCGSAGVVLLSYFMDCIALVRCVLVLRCGCRLRH